MYAQIRKILLSVVGIGLLLTAGFLSVAWYLTKVPYTAPGVVSLDAYVEIPRGSSAHKVGQILEDAQLIRSGDLFVATLRATGKENAIKSGDYYFNTPQPLQEVISRLTNARYNLPTTTITLFEGEANYKYAQRLAKQFKFVSEKEFNSLAKPFEGYLFPDTYTVSQRATAAEVIEKLQDNFDKRTSQLQTQVDATGHSWEDIITMASIVETEAGSASYETKQRVAGVLWRRIDIGMLLQADAVFSYIYQKHLPRVLYRHLEVDSPYNVYKNTGLPPGPISNPGLDSIRATMNPVDTGNLYYLTGNDGKFYYAKTLSGHEQNRRNYLKY